MVFLSMRFLQYTRYVLSYVSLQLTTYRSALSFDAQTFIIFSLLKNNSQNTSCPLKVQYKNKYYFHSY
jgi:hypothetical protein